MKAVIFKALLFLALVFTTVTSFKMPGDGQPSCTTQEEVNIHVFRNNWDPTSYWKCEELNVPAILERCSEQMAYLDSAKSCVDWEDWHWEQPIDTLTAGERS